MDRFKEWLDRIDVKLDRIDEKLDRTNSRIGELEVISAKHHIVLEDHQRRYIANEETVQLLRKELNPRVRVSWKTWGRAAATGAGIGGAIAGALKALGKI